jgi:hypothetical protein
MKIARYALALFVAIVAIAFAVLHWANKGKTVATDSNVVNKIVMVMITFRDDDGKITGYKQFHGPIVRSSDKDGIVVKAQDGQEISLPPQISALHPALPGEYSESDSGSVVKNPDFLSVWDLTIHSKENGGGTS